MKQVPGGGRLHPDAIDEVGAPVADRSFANTVAGHLEALEWVTEAGAGRVGIEGFGQLWAARHTVRARPLDRIVGRSPGLALDPVADRGVGDFRRCRLAAPTKVSPRPGDGSASPRRC